MDNLHKILLIVAVLLAILAALAGMSWLKAHDTKLRMEGDIRVRDEAIKNNQKTEQKAQVVVTNAEASNIAIDNQARKQLQQVEEQLSKVPDTQQTKQLIQAAIPKLQGVTETTQPNGLQFISVPDTKENRDAINHVDADFKSCKFNLDDCQQKQLNFLAEIDAKQTIINAKQATIDEQKQTIQELSRFGKGGNVWSRTLRIAVPIGCATGGAWLLSDQGRKAAAIGAGTAGSVCAFAFRF